ncbi:MAG: acyltransferase family protein, partial [Acidimicrobiia bacterium]|nr:acyltransferase family protein [Acidimicrobiia bacterium]
MAAPLSVPALRSPPCWRSLVDATPASRDRVVDALRALSIVVVVLWHWVLSVTHWNASGRLVMPNPVGDVPFLWLATWVLQVMPLFFVGGGVANLAAWERARERANVEDATQRRGGGAGAFLRARLSRLGRPVGVFLAVGAAAEAVARAFGAPSLLDWGIVVLVPLWFLTAYGAVVALVPLTAAVHRRGGALTLVALGAGVVLADLGRFRFGIEWLGLATTAFVWVFAHQLGYFWR